MEPRPVLSRDVGWHVVITEGVQIVLSCVVGRMEEANELAGKELICVEDALADEAIVGKRFAEDT